MTTKVRLSNKKPHPIHREDYEMCLAIHCIKGIMASQTWYKKCTHQI